MIDRCLALGRQERIWSFPRYPVYNPLRWYLDRYNENATGPDPLAREIWQMIQEDARDIGADERLRPNVSEE
jgi:hypothetical protein